MRLSILGTSFILDLAIRPIFNYMTLRESLLKVTFKLFHSLFSIFNAFAFRNSHIPLPFIDQNIILYTHLLALSMTLIFLPFSNILGSSFIVIKSAISMFLIEHEFSIILDSSIREILSAMASLLFVLIEPFKDLSSFGIKFGTSSMGDASGYFAYILSHPIRIKHFACAFRDTLLELSFISDFSSGEKGSSLAFIDTLDIFSFIFSLAILSEFHAITMESVAVKLSLIIDVAILVVESSIAMKSALKPVTFIFLLATIIF
mmetsp:Transcript_34946/g.31489  ORF Transcript_34946/g.31489 Transcript_34946/m.31489 type:complete len:261 (+) Transcript_34946:461-1243(+)